MLALVIKLDSVTIHVTSVTEPGLSNQNILLDDEAHVDHIVDRVMRKVEDATGVAVLKRKFATTFEPRLFATIVEL